MMFGRILALFRLAWETAAPDVLKTANQVKPKIVKWLVPAKKAKPKTASALGVLIGVMKKHGSTVRKCATSGTAHQARWRG